jgi:hypothetical protein
MPAFIIAIAAVGIVLGVTVASIPDSNGVIHACYGKVTGNVRIVESASQCTALETPTSWNQTGQPGPAGPAGPSGGAARFAHVTAHGELTTGNAVSATRLDEGVYQIDFGRDLTGCVGTASAGSAAEPATDFSLANGIAMVLVDPGSITVSITRASGTNEGERSDSGFNLVVTCPP